MATPDAHDASDLPHPPPPAKYRDAGDLPKARPGAEQDRMSEAGGMAHGPEEAGPWYEWGPYLAERAWGTVREDYSADGDAWGYFPFEHAHARAYRWNEDGLAGISDLHQDVCLSLGLWNGNDRVLKERLFGLTGPQGNHGEDVKEAYWYVDATPSHSWLRMLYHYPQAAFPYDDLIQTNAGRSRTEPEYEILDTQVFDEDRFFSVDVTYAKSTPTDIGMRIRITNNGPDDAPLDVLPTIWFRHTWGWGKGHPVPSLRLEGDQIVSDHWRAPTYHLAASPASDGTEPTALFCENESNPDVWAPAGVPPGGEKVAAAYPKDGIDRHVRLGADSVNPSHLGTKAAWWYHLNVPAGQTVELRLRLWCPTDHDPPRHDFSGEWFDALMTARESEADEFYAGLAPHAPDAHQQVMREAFAGLLWSKEFFRYDVARWLDGDPGEPAPPPGRGDIRNGMWRNLDSYDVISMPDAWEYPWFAAWDLAFHCVALSHVDPEFAKYQLVLMLREWFQHPNGAMPAYEWNFNDRNPPVHAWAALRVFEITGGTDYRFLEKVFHKLLLNFTWWVNRVDAKGNNVFEGGFLGLDNIGPLNRSDLPPGCTLEQADGTAWMAFYCLMMLRIALRLAEQDPVYDSMALKFSEHFAGISDGITQAGMWDANDGFFYDQLITPDGDQVPIKVRSMVGIIPMLAAAWVDTDAPEERYVRLRRRFQQFLHRRGVDNMETLDEPGFVYRSAATDKMLFAVLDPERLSRVLQELLSEESMLSPHGLRSLSKRHKDDPFVVTVDDQEFRVDYEPAESTTAMYGGNSNWRGPVWFPTNHLVIEALERYHMYLGDDFVVEFPTGSGELMTLEQVAQELKARLIGLFVPDENGRRPSFGQVEALQSNPLWNQHPWFFEYFNGDDGNGLGANHQTGWTGVVADMVIGRKG